MVAIYQLAPWAEEHAWLPSALGSHILLWEAAGLAVHEENGVLDGF